MHQRFDTFSLHHDQGILSLKYSVLCIKPTFTVYMYIRVQIIFLIYNIIVFFIVNTTIV